MTNEEKLDKLVAKIERLIADYNIKTEKYRGMNEQAHQYYGGKRDALSEILKSIDSMQEESASEDLEEACNSYYDETWDEHGGRAMVVDGCHDIWFPSHATDDFFKAGAKWQKEHLWKPADGNDLPEIDKEVIALIDYAGNGYYKVVFAHRPNPERKVSTNLLTGKKSYIHAKTYDKGGWNIPNVKWWLDVELPKEIEP